MRTDILEVLMQHIAAVARDRTVSADSSITRDIGLDSLSVMNFVMMLEDRFDVSIPMDMIVEVDTLRDLANVIETLHGGRAAA